MATIQELRTLALQIRDADEDRENTALKVGQFLYDLLGYLDTKADLTMRGQWSKQLSFNQTPIVALQSVEAIPDSKGQNNKMWWSSDDGQLKWKANDEVYPLGNPTYILYYCGNKIYRWSGSSTGFTEMESSGGSQISITAFSDYVTKGSTSELPSTGNSTTGYIVGSNVYAYVGTGGDTNSGKYKNLGQIKGADGVGFDTISTAEDGTIDIELTNGNIVTINLNHTHPNMANLIVCEESELPSTLDPATIYAITDSGETEIEKLIIRGMEFAGGGVPDTGEPMISSPSNGSTINLGTNEGSGVSKTITIKGKNLTGDLTVAVGTGLTISYGQSTGQSSVTIPMAQALLGAQVTIAYSGSGALNDGSLVISHDNAVLSSVVVVVAELPVGYTRLEYIENATKGIDTRILAVDSQDLSQNIAGTTWELDVKCDSVPSSGQMLICTNEDVGHWVEALANGKFGAGNDYSMGNVTVRSKIQVAFTSQSVSISYNGETKTRNYTYHNKRNVCLLRNINYNLQQYEGFQFTGKVYSIKCTSGGSFDAVPARRESDSKVGLYDKSNNEFYPLTD